MGRFDTQADPTQAALDHVATLDAQLAELCARLNTARDQFDLDRVWRRIDELLDRRHELQHR